MKVKELIEQLNKFHPDTQVRLITDHGQELMECNGVYVSYIYADTYMADEVLSEDLDECDDAIRVVVLEAY